VDRVARVAARGVREGWGALAVAVTRGMEALSYRRAELAVIGLLAASLLGGFAVDVWRRRDPAGLARVEAEPPRLRTPWPAPRRPPPPRSARTPGHRAGARDDPARPGRGDSLPEADAPIDLNRATSDELVGLPGIGPTLAERILARRSALGGRFESADDLATIPGIGPRTAARLRPRIVVRGRIGSPVDSRDPLEPWEPP